MKPSRLLKLFSMHSLQVRITLGTLILGLSVLWAAVLSLDHTLRRDMEATISAQQYSTVSLIANELDRSIRERQQIIAAIARQLPPATLQSPPTAQAMLERLELTETLFNWGIVIVDRKGIAVASIPAILNRAGVDFSTYPGVSEVLQGTELIGPPLISPFSGQPIVAMLAPIFDAQHQVIGSVIGVTNLSKPNFLDEISASKYGLTGDFIITAPKTRAYVASSDRRRVMTTGPARGVNAVYDKYIDGYEGSGIARSSRGVVELSSSKRIPATGWLMQSVLPVDEAFAPIESMERHLFMVSAVLTLIAGWLSWWWLRRQLRPLAETSAMLTDMRKGRIPRQPLPVLKNDEIGLLTAAFNDLQTMIIAEEGKAAEHAANTRLRRIVSSVPGVVFQYRRHLDGHGSFPFASDGIKEVYGVTHDEVMHDTGLLRKMVHPDDWDHFFATMEASAQSMAPWRVEYRICMRDGTIKWLLVKAIPERNEDGSITWYGFIADISETKAMEAEIAHYRDHLEQLVAERTHDLEIARADAEHLAHAKSEFLAKMSHEIRTPLHGVLGMAHIGQRASSEGSKAREAFIKINQSGQLLLGILNDILDFSKIEAGMLKVELTVVRLADLLDETIELMRERATAKGLKFEENRDGSLPVTCRTDSLRLRQILLNLLSNSIKFTTDGSVRLDSSLDGNQLLFRVTDTGIGITEEQRTKIFNPFEQGDNTMTRRFGGTGLGLAITEHIVQLMGGSIRLESTPGQGSCFEVRLPYLPTGIVEAPSIDLAKLPTGDGQKRLAGLRILVAEDVEINQEIMQEILTDMGASPTLVANGKEAVDAVRSLGSGAFDIVLMDIQMPIMNGHQATREIRAIAPDLPVIGQTAHALAEERAACLASGMVAHISKPIDPDKLVALILQHTQKT